VNLKHTLAKVYADHLRDFLHRRLLQNAGLPLQHASRLKRRPSIPSGQAR
jgi:hypothetical protein